MRLERVVGYLLLIINNGVVTGQTTTAGGNATAPHGDNVDIFWKLNDITSLDTVNAYFNQTSDPNEIFSTTVGTVTVNKTISIKASNSETPSALVNLKSRLSVVYIYTGEVGGKDSGRIIFSISNVKLEDINSYILKIGRSSDITSLTVNTRPVQISSINATLIGNEKVAVSWNVYGKPRPDVTCRIEQGSAVTLKPTEVSTYNYEYTGIISNFSKTLQGFDQCDQKTVSCTATGYNGTQIKNSTIVKRNCSSSQQERISSEVCAGHIIGFEVGVVFIVVFIVFLAWWRVEKTRVKLIVFTFSLTIGLGLTIGLAVSYAGLREIKTNGTCDRPFIVLGVIDGIVILIALVVSFFVKFKGVHTVPLHGAKNEESPLNPTKQNPPPKGTENVEIK